VVMLFASMIHSLHSGEIARLTNSSAERNTSCGR
jgi:hypothetical protein